MHLADPIEDVVGDFLLLLAGGMLDNVELERIADSVLEVLSAATVTYGAHISHFGAKPIPAQTRWRSITARSVTSGSRV